MPGLKDSSPCSSLAYSWGAEDEVMGLIQKIIYKCQFYYWDGFSTHWGHWREHPDEFELHACCQQCRYTLPRPSTKPDLLQGSHWEELGPDRQGVQGWSGNPLHLQLPRVRDRKRSPKCSLYLAGPTWVLSRWRDLECSASLRSSLSEAEGLQMPYNSAPNDSPPG